MKIGVITYDKPHKKTQEVLYGLHKLGYKKIKLIIGKFRNFKKKKIINIFEHRPFQFEGLNYKELSKLYGLEYCDYDNINVLNNLDVVLVCGSALISGELIKKNLILNCHSGLIPMRRGLDAFKWSILNKEMIGNTLHYIDKSVDFGKIISHKITPLFKSDNLDIFARRHYDEEINMLINFENHIKKPNKLKLDTNKPNMRMPLNLEKKMVKIFQSYKDKFFND